MKRNVVGDVMECRKGVCRAELVGLRYVIFNLRNKNKENISFLNAMLPINFKLKKADANRKTVFF